MKILISLLIGSFLIGSQPSVNTGRYILVDFSKPSTEKRLYVMDNGFAIYSTYTAHGSGSSNGDKFGKWATSFSNTPNSYMSSLGKYKIAEIYYGKHGKSYKVDGLESTNSNARKRLIAIHPASYIGYGKVGTTQGCFGIPTQDAAKLYSYITKGMILIAVN